MENNEILSAIFNRDKAPHWPYSAEIISGIKKRFIDVYNSGYLFSYKRRCELDLYNPSDLKPVDFLAGDDNYIFLSFGRRDEYFKDWPEANYGFIFDAFELIKMGATLRTHDLIKPYNDLWDKLLIGFSEPEKGNLERLCLRENKPVDLTKLKQNFPEIQKFCELFYMEAKNLKSSADLSGQEALALLEKNGPNSDFELLIPQRLPVSKAIKYIVASEIISKSEFAAWISTT
ncbi:MAG: hypothetical protein J0I20_29355 [Chloroflexi bacterium]|nr:hypothetical protein [Chloroflexota bacterium]